MPVYDASFTWFEPAETDGAVLERIGTFAVGQSALRLMDVRSGRTELGRAAMSFGLRAGSLSEAWIAGLAIMNRACAAAGHPPRPLTKVTVTERSLA